MVSDAKKQTNAAWDRTHMVTIGCRVRRDTAEEFKRVCKENGTTMHAVFKAAMDSFMQEHSSNINGTSGD